MATLMDQIMGRTNPRSFSNAVDRDFTLGGRATFQPYDRPFSRDGTLGNMGMRNMLEAQRRLAATGVAPSLPASATNSPEYMQALYNQLNRAPTGVAPALPIMLQPGMPRGVAMPSAMPVPPPGVMGMAPLGGFTPMAPPPMNITPTDAAAPAAGFLPPANVPLPPPRPADISVRESFMQRLLGNPTQSNSMPVLPAGATLPSQVNWGDVENPADFFRASQVLQGLLG